MATSKHVHKSGATTVKKKNGKIVGNIGAGKPRVPVAGKDHKVSAQKLATQISSDGTDNI